jgi:hypothetical protein
LPTGKGGDENGGFHLEIDAQHPAKVTKSKHPNPDIPRPQPEFRSWEAGQEIQPRTDLAGFMQQEWGAQAAGLPCLAARQNTLALKQNNFAERQNNVAMAQNNVAERQNKVAMEQNNVAETKQSCDGPKQRCGEAKQRCDGTKQRCGEAKQRCDDTKQRCGETEQRCFGTEQFCDAAKT